ncbi:MAG: desulfoferrodoxin family protein [Anaerovoracaceae bacterium]
MKKDVKFFRCEHCGNIATLIEAAGPPLVCCGEEMKLLDANTSDGAGEKHVPVINVDGNKVKVVVSTVTHPMVEAHHIAWIYLLTEQGEQIKYLDHTGAPEAEFAILDGDKVIAAYEYCNLHSLWKAEY